MLMDFKVGEDGFLIDRIKSNEKFPVRDGFIRMEVANEIFNDWRRYKYVDGEFLFIEEQIIEETKELELIELEKELIEAIKDAVPFMYNNETYYYRCDSDRLQTLILYSIYLENHFKDSLMLNVLDGAGYQTSIFANKQLVADIIEAIVLARSERLTKFNNAHKSINNAKTIDEALLDSYEL